jgi:histidinol phosphatase-like PHP family hydrolase
MTLADLVKGAGEQGIVDYGLTDHIHTPYNLPDLYAARAEFDEVVNSPRVHFGVEVSVVSQWELDELARTEYPGEPVYGIRKGGPEGAAPAIGLAEEEMRALGIEYVVGGVHWPLYVPIEREAVIRDYHRQNMFLATHPLVTIVAHPWWWMGAWRDADGMYRSEPWLDDFGHIPQSMHEEFAAAAREHGAVVEFNLGATVFNRSYPEGFKRQYVEYVAWLQGEGVTLSIGSDCHDEQYHPDFERAAEILEAAGIEESRLWRLG